MPTCDKCDAGFRGFGSTCPSCRKSPSAAGSCQLCGGPHLPGVSATCADCSRSSKNNCASCGKRVYEMEKLVLDGQLLHTACFKCIACGLKLSVSNFGKAGDRLFCRKHFEEQECESEKERRGKHIALLHAPGAEFRGIREWKAHAFQASSIATIAESDGFIPSSHCGDITSDLDRGQQLQDQELGKECASSSSCPSRRQQAAPAPASVLPVAVAASAPAGVARTACLQTTEEDKASKHLLDSGDAQKETGERTTEINSEQLQQILDEIIESQEQMKACIKELTQERLRSKLTFDQMYKRIKELQPADPLEKYGLSMVDFDELLEKHSDDDRVREALAKMSGAPDLNSCSSEKAQSEHITIHKIVDAHRFMLEQLEKVISAFLAIPDRTSYDIKIVMLTAQAIACSKIEQTFGATFEAIVSAIPLYYECLSEHQEFGSLTVSLQQAMDKLLGA